MGCTHSSPVYRQNDQLEDFVTSQDVQRVQMSWKILGSDITRTGLLVFRKLFDDKRNLKKLFVKLMFTRHDGVMLFDEKKLSRHATIVMQGLGAAVESLEDSIFLTNILIAMGRRHAQYHVKAEMVPLLWPAIRDAFKEILQEEFDFEVENAWKHVFEYISSKFKHGIKIGEKFDMNEEDKSD